MKKNDKCPFLEEVVVRYCKAYPITKMIPMDKLQREDPCIGCPHKCSIYQEVAHVSSCQNGAEKMAPVSAEFTCHEDNSKLENVRGFSFHPSVYYLDNHIWVKTENNNQAQIGFDDFASKLLGEIAGIVPSQKGEILRHIKVEQHNRLQKVPVQTIGKIIRVNDQVLAKPETISQNPYAIWLYAIENTNMLDSLKNSRKGSDAKKWLVQEADSLQEMLQQECGITLNDGGEIVADLQKRISESVAQKIIKRFLKVE